MAPQDTSYLFSTGALAGHPMFCDDLFFDSEDLRTFEAEHKEAMDGAVGADITEVSGSCAHHIITLGHWPCISCLTYHSMLAGSTKG